MPKNDTLTRLSETICSDYLGFKPTSNSTKPPHIANGLFRLCTGEFCDTRDVHKWILSEERKNSKSSKEIIEEYQEILQNGYKEKETNIKQLRFLLDDIFGQDNTVYPEYNFSVMTISSHWMINGRLSSEERIGDFLFSVLSKFKDNKRSPVIDLLQTTLSKDFDDLTKLVKPIITFPSDKEKRTLNGINYINDDEIEWDLCKEKIRRGFDQLAKNIIAINEDKNNLLVLRRIVCFAGFATYLYLTHANNAIYGGNNPPLLLDAGTDLESIKRASEKSFTVAKKAVEDYFTNSIKDIISQEITCDSIAECNKWIQSMVFSNSDRSIEILKAIESYFKSFCDEGENSPMLALAKALQIALYTFEYKSNSPSDFSRVLGVRCGLIGPKGNRATVKRYLINSFTLETITLSLLSRTDLNEGIELKELSERANDAYNILLGADAEEEYRILESCNIAQSTPGDLRGDLTLNAQRLADTYVSLGLAKKYADGVTLIEWRQ